MIVVDSSVWIHYLAGTATPQVNKLEQLMDRREILVGDLVLCEVLQGVHSEREASRVEDALRRFTVVEMLNDRFAVRSAANYRTLQARGITIRKTIDLFIGTFCIERGYPLLHDDRDFEPMTRYLGLVVH